MSLTYEKRRQAAQNQRNLARQQAADARRQAIPTLPPVPRNLFAPPTRLPGSAPSLLTLAKRYRRDARTERNSEPTDADIQRMLREFQPPPRPISPPRTLPAVVQRALIRLCSEWGTFPPPTTTNPATQRKLAELF